MTFPLETKEDVKTLTMRKDIKGEEDTGLIRTTPETLVNLTTESMTGISTTRNAVPLTTKEAANKEIVPGPDLTAED